MRRPTLILSALALSLFPFSVQGEVPSAILLGGDALPGGPPGHTITALNNTAVNHAGGYSVTLNSTDGVTTLSHAWGSSSGGPGGVLWTEGTFGQYRQDSWESFYGMTDNGAVAYSPLCTDTGTGVSGLDAVYLNDNKIMIENEPYPHQPGMYWTFGSRADATADGVPYFVGGITVNQGAATTNRGLFYGPTATPLLLGGWTVAGLPDTLDHNATVSFDYRFSALGTHYTAEVQTVTGLTTNDNHVVIDGAVALAGGSPVSEASPVPPGAGGLPGENWDNFDFMGIDEEGHWMFTGDTDADVALDEFIAFDGAILFREGDGVSGEVLSGSIEGAYMNEQEDIAYIWDIQNNLLEALFLNDRMVLKEGDEVDLDGDGIPEAGTALLDFTGISTLTMSDRDGNDDVRIYFTANVEVPAARLAPGMEIARETGADIRFGEGWREERGIAEGDDSEESGEPGTRVTVEGYFVVVAPAVETGVAEGEGMPYPTGRLDAYPNPSKGESRIRFHMPESGPADLDVYDLAGRHVRTLATGIFPRGEQSVLWDGRDENGRTVANGVYFLRYQTGERAMARRITLVR
ncbi:MAG: FlgD immunoglobulin-like domain containing protein [Candidatus Eisenbacteria bacterium]